MPSRYRVDQQVRPRWKCTVPAWVCRAILPKLTRISWGRPGSPTSGMLMYAVFSEDARPAGASQIPE